MFQAEVQPTIAALTVDQKMVWFVVRLFLFCGYGCGWGFLVPILGCGVGWFFGLCWDGWSVFLFHVLCWGYVGWVGMWMGGYIVS